MVVRLPVRVLLACLLVPGTALGVPPRPPPKPAAAEQPPYCLGAYADDLNALSVAARRLEQSTRYTFCVRSTAVYQCLSYDRDGNVRRRKDTVTAHGTAFAFSRVPGFTYLLTNEHVSEWPLVTEEAIDDVPPGCKRVSQTVSIVEDEKDQYDADDIPLQRVVVEHELDATILRAPARLPVIPFKLGQSAALRAGNAVQVRGFPLGAFQAINVGKVITPRDHDTERRWDHDDFVIDALLSQGNSGSPVLAVNCATRELELVGLYHAGYRAGSALNVVVGVDELRDIMTTLRPRKKRDAKPELTAAHRARVLELVQSPTQPPAAPFGAHVVGVRAGPGGALLYDVYSRDYPLSDRRLLVIEDLPSEGGFGRLGRLWFGSEHGLIEYALAELEGTDQLMVQRVLLGVRGHLVRVLQYRGLEPTAVQSRPAHERLRALERQIARGEPVRRDLARAIVDAASRYGPEADDESVPIVATTRTAPQPATPPAGPQVAGKVQPAAAPAPRSR